MKFKYLAAAFAMAAGMIANDAHAKQTPWDTPSPYIQFHGNRSPMTAHKDLCVRIPVECAPYSTPGQTVKLTPGVLNSLNAVNRKVNNRIRYSSDTRNYGHIDYWNVPNSGTGDCEDYALAKRRELIGLGWPRSSLLLAIAYAETGTGHAVLIARTDQGDFVLDNRRRNAQPWHKLPYTWIAIQSTENPKKFSSIASAVPLPPVTRAPQ